MIVILDASSAYGESLLSVAQLQLSLRTDTLVLDARSSLDLGFVEYVRWVRRGLAQVRKKRPNLVILGGPNQYLLYDKVNKELLEEGLSDTWHWAANLIFARHRVELFDVEQVLATLDPDNWDVELMEAATTSALDLPVTPLTKLGTWSYSGHPKPVVVFVGDKLSPTLDEAAWHDWPFSLPTGSSAFLGRALSQAGLAPRLHKFGFCNLNDKGGEKTLRLLMNLTPGLGLVSLGQEAQRELVNMGLRPDMHAHHPQYARRFRFKELRQYGQELLEGYHLALGTERDAAARP